MPLYQIADPEKRAIKMILDTNHYWNDSRMFDESSLINLKKAGYINMVLDGDRVLVTLTYKLLDRLRLYADPDARSGEKIWKRNESPIGLTNHVVDLHLMSGGPGEMFHGEEFLPTLLIGSNLMWRHAGLPTICEACHNFIQNRHHYCIRCDRIQGDIGPNIVIKTKRRNVLSIDKRKNGYLTQKRNLARR